MADQIKLTLLFAGGHQQTVEFARDDPQFLQLVGLFASGDAAAKRNAFVELALDGGTQGISFTVEHLVGLVTDPITSISALLKQAPLSRIEVSVAPIEPVAPAASAQPAEPIARLVPSRVWQLDNFLAPDAQRRLLDYVIRQEKNFVATGVDTDDASYRASLVLHHFPEFAKLFRDKIKQHMGKLGKQFDLGEFAPSEIECQLTAHNDGNYYLVHNDNGSAPTASRQFTYVYYFNREPKAFEGGQLRVYDSRVENNFYVQADTYQDIQPRNNSIVFFQSYCLHEVLPVQCPSQAFADSRFTVNGWLRR